MGWVSRGALRRAVFVLLLLAASRLASAWPEEDDTSIEAQLGRWLLSKGAELNGVAVGQECPTCMRGVLATKSFEDDDVIMKLPYSVMIAFKEGFGYSAELARDWLDRMHNEPGFNETWRLYWEGLPTPGHVFTPELYTDQHLDMLHTPELEDLISRHRQVTEEVYSGACEGRAPAPPMAQLAPAVSLDTFKHVAGLIHSRSFGLPRGTNGSSVGHMIPLLDLINHSDEPNSWWHTDDLGLVLKARGPITQGQEVTHDYITDVAHRPDMSLFSFGFVVPKAPPLMAAVDLPTFDEYKAYAETPPDDSMYDEPGGEYVTQEEYERLAERLDAAPTSEGEDQMVLDSGMVTDWRLQTLLQFRIARKRALRLAMDRIAEHLGWHHEHAGEAGTPLERPHAEQEDAAEAGASEEAASGEL